MLKKRGLFVALLAAGLSAGTLCAQQASVGGGVFTDLGRAGPDITVDSAGSASANADTFGYGVFMFVSGGFIEFSLGLFLGSHFLYNQNSEPVLQGAFFAKDLTLLLRYPFHFSGHSVFPIAGIGARIGLFSYFADVSLDTTLGELSHFRLFLGLGGDIAIIENMFLRGQLLGYYRFASRFERNMANSLTDTASGVRFEANGGFGFQVRMAVGFTF